MRTKRVPVRATGAWGSEEQIFGRRAATAWGGGRRQQQRSTSRWSWLTSRTRSASRSRAPSRAASGVVTSSASATKAGAACGAQRVRLVRGEGRGVSD